MKSKFSLILVMVVALYSASESRAGLLQNTEFETDLAGWTIGAVDPLGTWDVQWSGDHEGSAKMYISGSPAQTNISQATLKEIAPGDKITVNVYHTEMGNFSGWAILLDTIPALRSNMSSEGFESLTWTANQHYNAGTLFTVSCSVWPGSSTTWVENIIYTPVPEPATLLLLGFGGLVLRRGRK